MLVDSQRLVFVGGLHRSGTTALARMLADHPQISGLERTGVREDEGQHVQDVYPVAQTHGGPGRFARRGAAHLTEASPLLRPDPEAAGDRMLTAWMPYWDLERPFLVEKSPPNLIMGRFLQAAFPQSCLVVVVRHPVVVALSTKKWAPRTSWERLVEHWFLAHDQLAADAPALRRLLVLRYEDLMEDPQPQLERVRAFVGLDGAIPGDRIDTSRSSRYEQEWDALANGSWWQRKQRDAIERRFGDRAAAFGYSISDLRSRTPFAWPS
jgi:hypothetical protein